MQHKKPQGHDIALPPLRNISSGIDASDHHQLSIGDMNSTASTLSRARSGGSGSFRSERSERQVQPQQRYEPGKLYTLIPGRLSFTAHEDDDHTVEEIQRNPLIFFFSTDLQERYLPFCSDFGPVNIGTLVQFCEYVRDKEADPRLQNRHLVYYCTNDYESVSNTAFLLSAYLMLEHGMTPEKAVAPFRTIAGIPIVPFRDPTFVESSFPLTVLDCLRGLNKAVECEWFDLNEFDLEQYEDLDHPENGDMHQICPKFVAFRGPEQRSQRDPETGAASPELVIEMFKKLRVSKVIRLNESDAYDRKVFVNAGMQHLDLYFEDCTTPTDELVVRFLEEVKAPGVVAVHCLAGLGRTGTMIGLWLMSKHGFTAREAIAWMRIVRPGCVIGPQQHYLEWMEKRLRAGTFPCSLAPSHPSERFAVSSAALSEQLASQVRKAITRRN